ncbi:hypothetical protein KP509_19G033300 [Ceratopteris richardii]|uniref:Uncharacterized protein n=1 Tax=Ceratopteris richardii TaxID=49495 RepID=A0A8T2SL45_CERRI|nr:hypothetical protein KP509_19G033300 [Ceratopteris richardii]
MGLIYELIDKMIEKILALQSIDSQRLEEVKDLCIARWYMLHSPLHTAAFVIHPIRREKAPHMDTEVYHGWMDVLEGYTHGDVAKQCVLCDELDAFKSMSGEFLRPLVREKSRMHYAIRWWEQFGLGVPNLQSLLLVSFHKGLVLPLVKKIGARSH